MEYAMARFAAKVFDFLQKENAIRVTLQVEFTAAII